MPSLSPAPRPVRRTAVITASVAAACALALTPATAASAALVPEPVVYSAHDAALSLHPIGTFETGVFDESAAEIVTAYGNRLFVVNALAGSVSVLDYSNPKAPKLEFEITAAGVANSVAVRPDGLGVIAFEAPVKTDPGSLVFFDADAGPKAALSLGERHGRRTPRHGDDQRRRQVRGQCERGRAGGGLLGRPRRLRQRRQAQPRAEVGAEAEGRAHGGLPRVRSRRIDPAPRRTCGCSARPRAATTSPSRATSSRSTSRSTAGRPTSRCRRRTLSRSST